jgi:hypothetical protein
MLKKRFAINIRLEAAVVFHEKTRKLPQERPSSSAPSLRRNPITSLPEDHLFFLKGTLFSFYGIQFELTRKGFRNLQSPMG